jgi:hypothetical protein
VAYIGNPPYLGQWRKLDDISGSFNGSATTFTTSVAGSNVTAGTAQQLLVSLGGVIQSPNTDYTVTTYAITFTTAPAAGLSFSAVLMGDTLNTGSPSDGSVGTSKLASNLTVDLALGSNSAPSLSFDSDSGLYSPADNNVSIATAGAERARIKSSGAIRCVTALTVATLPTGETGDIARVTDASAPSVGATVSGGGAANALCWYNGSNWKVIGV